MCTLKMEIHIFLSCLKKTKTNTEQEIGNKTGFVQSFVSYCLHFDLWVFKINKKKRLIYLNNWKNCFVDLG